MKRLAPGLVAVLSLVLLALAGDVFQDYGLDRKAWAERFRWAIEGSGFIPPSIPARLKTLAPAERVLVVQALGAAAKAYFGSAEFKADLQARAARNGPGVPKPPRTAKQIADEARAEIQKQIAESEALLKTVPAEVRSTVSEAIAMARERLKTIDADAKAAADLEQEVYKMEKAQYDEHMKSAGDVSAAMGEARDGLRDALKTFLADTEGVNYAAKTAIKGGVRVFAEQKDEERNKGWKQCYRAGREACEAARTFATGWLSELK